MVLNKKMALIIGMVIAGYLARGYEMSRIEKMNAGSQRDSQSFKEEKDVQPAPSTSFDEKGLTLVEVSIVLAILSIMAMIAVPQLLKMQPKIELRNAASELSEVMMMARTRAVTERRNYTVNIDLTNDTYAITPQGGASLPPIGDTWKGVDIYNDTSDPSVDPFTADDVIFFPTGAADPVGYEAVYLRSGQTAERYRVKVLGPTGKMSMERWIGATWTSVY